MAIEHEARCGATGYGEVARANFAEIEARLVALEATDTALDGKLLDTAGVVISVGAISATQLVSYTANTGVLAQVDGVRAGSTLVWNGSDWVDSGSEADSREDIIPLLTVENSSEPASGYDQWAAMSLAGSSYDAGGKVKWEWCWYMAPSASGPQCDFYVKFRSADGSWSRRMQLGSSGNNYIEGNLTATLGFYGKIQVSADSTTGTASRLTLTNQVLTPSTGSVLIDNVPTNYTNPPIYLKAFNGTDPIAILALPYGEH